MHSIRLVMGMSLVGILLGLAAGALISIGVSLAVVLLLVLSPLPTTSASWVISGGGGGFFGAGKLLHNN